jgi:hypothetical protein
VIIRVASGRVVDSEGVLAVASPDASDLLRDAKSSILLKEWETLRTEILARMQSQYQLLTFTVVAATFIYSQERLDPNWLLVGVAGLFFGCVDRLERVSSSHQ